MGDFANDTLESADHDQLHTDSVDAQEASAAHIAAANPHSGAASDAELATHEADTTAVHGIANTALLETTAGSQTKVDTHAAAGNPHPTYETSAEAQAKVDAHEADTSVHGIADTTALATDAEVATAVSDHAAAANPHPTYETSAEAQAKVDTHEADTSVHGIADTTVLATDAEVATAVSNHEGAANPHPTYETSAEAQAKVDAHTGDTSDAHDASAVSVAPAGGIAATDVQAALEELDSEKSGTAHAHDATYVNEGDHTKAAHDALTLSHDSLSDVSANDHHAQAHGNGDHTATFITAADAAPPSVDYLVGTASGGLSAEIVVGTTPGGELGGTWASPTVDATHSGSAHHTEAHALNAAVHTGTLNDAQIPAAIMRDAEHTAASHQAAGASDLSGYYARLASANTFTEAQTINGGSQAKDRLILGSTPIYQHGGGYLRSTAFIVDTEAYVDFTNSGNKLFFGSGGDTDIFRASAGVLKTTGGLIIGGLSATAISLGAADSGGAGFKVLRVPN